ncbi:MAG: hypothetical protein HHJ13_01515 [Phycicoccus sp.]|nr:hypothetical protein [Phycicoccus sp.]
MTVGSGAATAYRAFTYDALYSEAVRLLPRAVDLLDYTPGGPDWPTYAGDVYGHDEIHGESGDDTVYTGGGNDVIFGDAGDDDLIGGWGHDWISGGTGVDGILGDDGRIFTSRNGLTEPLNGVTAANAQVEIATPGRVQVGILFPTGKLNKTVDLTPFAADGDWANPLNEILYANDVIFGGWDDDFIHGGSGDDAISGAEALVEGYGMDGVRSDFFRPFNDGTLLGFDPSTGMFPLYDEYNPMRKILLNADGSLSTSGTGHEWFLNFDYAEGRNFLTTAVRTDGDDVIFGDHGNDWAVGGTGRDTLWGGWGNDLLNADDVLTTNGGLNDAPDTHTSYEDRVVGGAGLDILIGNTGGDRLIDWVGEFNSYLVPFAPFGIGTVSRQVPPGLYEFLYALSRAQGADFTIAQLSGEMYAARNGEPYGEIGLVTQKDDFWQEQTGGPRDPQPGNVPGGKRDVLRSADFNDGTAQAFFADSGVFAVQGGTLTVTAASTSGDAAAVYYIDQYLPIYYEINAQVYLTKPTGGWKANAYVIFDYFGPTDFKFAGVDQSTNKLVMGRRTAAGWIVDVQSYVPGGVRYNKWYTMLVAVNGTTVTVLLDGATAFTHTFAPRILDGVAYGLNKGFIGVGSDRARGMFDNISVRVLPPAITLDVTEEFDNGGGLVSEVVSGEWSASGGVLTGAAGTGGAPALALAAVGRLEANAYLEITAKISLGAGARAGVVYDFYGSGSYKFIVLDQAAGAVVFGHVVGGKRVVDDTVAWTLRAGASYTMLVTVKGASVSLVVNGAFVRSRAYNAALADGRFGLIVEKGAAQAASLRIRTDSAGAAVISPAVVAAQPASASVAPTASASVAPTEPAPVAPTEPAPVAEPESAPAPAPEPGLPPAPAPPGNGKK